MELIWGEGKKVLNSVEDLAPPTGRGSYLLLNFLRLCEEVCFYLTGVECLPSPPTPLP